LSVFSDSRLLLRFLRGEELPFSEGVIYIFEKQIEETSLLIANKIDLLSAADAETLLQLAKKRYPDKTVRLQNSLDKTQVTEWLSLIQSQTLPVPQESLDLDYTVYAQGEGLFAWLDRDLAIEFFDFRQVNLITELIAKIMYAISSKARQVAHLKFLVTNGKTRMRLNITSLDDLESMGQTTIFEPGEIQSSIVELIINVMVEGDMPLLDTVLEDVIQAFAAEKGVEISEKGRFTRTPGFPKPTKRLI
jgi:hypothetical protein